MRTLDSTLRFTGVSDVVTIGGTSAESEAFTAYCHDVRLVSTINCWITFGTTAVATASAADGSIYLPAGVVEYFHVTPGQVVAVIQDAAEAGTLSVGEMSR
jgi:hypothetical protein